MSLIRSNGSVMETVYGLISLIILLVAVSGVVTNSPFSLFVLASTEDDGWVEGDYEGSLEEQEKQAQEDWEDAGRPGEDDESDDDDDDNDNESDEELYECPDGSLVPLDTARCPNLSAQELRELEEAILNDPTAPDWLPECNGSYQDCITEDGDICVAGSTAHECETFNPELDGPIASGVLFPIGTQEENGPNPYCDLVPDWYHGSCHDRKDASDTTRLYTCNDGTHEEDWKDCKDVSGYDYSDKDNGNDGGDGPSQSTRTTLTIAEPDPNRFSPTGGGVYFPTEPVSNPDRLKFGPFGIPLPLQVDEEFSSIQSASRSAPEESSCKILGSTDGILQMFDTAKYQACGLYTNGQKAYSDGFVAGCIQVGNTQLICQSLVDSSKLNLNIFMTQTPSQVVTQPTQGIQPAAVNE